MKKLSETNEKDLFSLIKSRRLFLLYNNKYILIRNIRKDNKKDILILDDDESNLLFFNSFKNDLYVYN